MFTASGCETISLSDGRCRGCSVGPCSRWLSPLEAAERDFMTFMTRTQPLASCCAGAAGGPVTGRGPVAFAGTVSALGLRGRAVGGDGLVCHRRDPSILTARADRSSLCIFSCCCPALPRGGNVNLGLGRAPGEAGPASGLPLPAQAVSWPQTLAVSWGGPSARPLCVGEGGPSLSVGPLRAGSSWWSEGAGVCTWQ